MTPADFFAKAVEAAAKAGHIFPDYAACEAALETGWGESRLAREANNLFGQKQGFTTGEAECIDIPTTEFINGEWCTMPARWPKFPSWEDSFRARMHLLKMRTAYASALAAPTGEEFVRRVSMVWATDPERSAKVLSIYRHHKHEIDASMPPDPGMAPDPSGENV